MFRKDIVLGGVCAGMFVMPQLMTARQLVTDGGDKPNIIFILADDMGLGKTLQTIAYLSAHLEEGQRVLVLSPS